MKAGDLSGLEEWFAAYCSGFVTGIEEDDRNIALKRDHTGNVCTNIDLIAATLSLEERERRMATAVALLHDVGRFEQYRRFSTFRDSDSVSHAALGRRILVEADSLHGLEKEEREIILQSVELHSAFKVPQHLDPRVSLFVKLVRDADKLDIWRVFIEYYESPPEKRASAVSLGFPELPDCSPDVLKQLLMGKMVRLSMLKTLNDFKLLQLSWVFDLNFPESFRLVRERRIVHKLAETLPSSREVSDCLAVVENFIDGRILTFNC